MPLPEDFLFHLFRILAAAELSYSCGISTAVAFSVLLFCGIPTAVGSSVLVACSQLARCIALRSDELVGLQLVYFIIGVQERLTIDSCLSSLLGARSGFSVERPSERINSFRFSRIASRLVGKQNAS